VILDIIPCSCQSLSAFRERLSDSEFNQKQMAMLQLRLDLLDSFLRGTGGDVSFFFHPGRLVIVDLSDPFVDGERSLDGITMTGV
jgi:hypothetical protein